MELNTDIPRVILQLDDLYTNTLIILADEVETCLGELVDVVGVDFISVAVTLVDLDFLAIQLTKTRPFASRLEERWAKTKTHRSTEVGLVNFGHEDNEWIGALFVQFNGTGASDTTHIAGKFDDSNLHTQADTQVRGLVCACPFCRSDHALCTALAKSSWNQNTICGTNFMPCLVKGGGVVGTSLFLEVGGINPDEVEFLAATHCAVFEGLDD